MPLSDRRGTLHRVANYLDFLVAFDEHIRTSSLGFVIYGHELFGIAQQAGLIAPADQSPARWTGELVALGYMSHGPLGLGDRRPLPPGAYASEDLSRVSDYRITATGRAEADRIRRQRREAATDAALNGVFPTRMHPSMSDAQRGAVSVPLINLRAALDHAQHAAAVGSAKDLTEAACKVAIECAGATPPANASLPTLFKEAATWRGGDASAEFGRSLSATVQRLAELRNAVGSGHGRAVQPDVTARDARLAASAACGLAGFLLDPDS